MLKQCGDYATIQFYENNYHSQAYNALHWKLVQLLTIPLSWKFVAMTMTSLLFSQTILQKSSTVFSIGP